MGLHAEARDHAVQGFERVAAAAQSTAGKTFYAVKAMNGTLTFDAGCVVAKGDAPADGDTLLQGDVLHAPFSTVAVKTGSAGVAYCFHDKPQ